MMSNFSIPNEYENEPKNSNNQPGLSKMLVNHQIQSILKPMVDFQGNSVKRPEPPPDPQASSSLEEEVKTQYIRLKRRYRNLKESMQFHPKN